jgi:hypothetical protein
MSIRQVRVVFVCILIAFGAASRSAEILPSVDKATISLRYGSSVELSEDDSKRLLQQAMEILESSNFSSANPQWEWDYAKVSAEYEQAVSGRHLLVTFADAKKIRTIGGYVSVWKLIIGLNGSQYASPVHTVDGTGVVIGHAKYEGMLCVRLMDLVKEIIATLPNNTLVPTRKSEALLLAAQRERWAAESNRWR